MPWHFRNRWPTPGAEHRHGYLSRHSGTWIIFIRVAFPGTNLSFAYVKFRLHWHNRSVYQRNCILSSFKEVEKGSQKDQRAPLRLHQRNRALHKFNSVCASARPDCITTTAEMNMPSL